MTQHTLQGRSEDEVMWFQRRGFLQAAAAWTAAGSLGAAHAQAHGNVVELMGDATVNGQRLLPQQSVMTGDEIVTGPRSTLIFVVGNSAFHMRQNSSMLVERGPSINAVSLLRLLTGAVVSVWGKGSSRRIVTPTLTAGIRGTGVYTEVFSNQGGRSYFCNCYGVVDLAAGNDREVSESSYHQAVWAEPVLDGRSALTPARAINHTDEELEYLARLVGQRTAWQISGKKGDKGTVREYGG
ncbi:MAG: iron dicitrate transport regulator FecR [Rhodoferax sp.]|nr:iron dicitrate transport regulator FecR [Rhodoferax sp.]